MRRLPPLIPGIAAGFAACTLYSPPPIPAPRPAGVGVYSRAELTVDLDSMLAIDERVHPALYAFQPRDFIARMRAAFIATLPDSARAGEVYLGFARILAVLGDGHTTVEEPPDASSSYYAAGGRAFPLGFAVGPDQHLRVSASLSPMPAGVSRGDRLLTVNGHDADSLLRVFMSETSAESELWRRRVAAQGFGGSLRLHHIGAPFEITVADSIGAVHAVTIAGLGRAEIESINTRSRAVARRAPGRDRNYTYRALGDGNGYLDFYSMSGDAASFRSRIAVTFAQIERDSVKALIVDLRRNGGGNAQLGVDLLSHFVDRPYRTESMKEMRVSAEYRERAREGINPRLRWLHVEYLIPEGRRYFRAPLGSIAFFPEMPKRQARAEPRFDKPVCVLIGTGTFSSAMEIADGVQTYHLATTLGEPTGGLPSAFGEVYYYRLPVTGMLAGVSTARYLRASGDTSDHGPVRPDILIPTSAEDIRLNHDPVLERARHCAEFGRTQ
jgi:hypothetical protein